jgi:D-tyrosyl-tRNA(Tyr) deacylase
VKEASVVVEGTRVAAIGRGFLVFLGIRKGDTRAVAEALAARVANLRVFNDEAGKMGRALAESGGAILVVSQMTLYGDCSRGRRPSFDQVAGGDEARPLYECFVESIRAAGLKVETGVFGAMMDVGLVNDGPVTFLLES